MFWHLYGVQVLVFRSSDPFILVVWLFVDVRGLLIGGKCCVLRVEKGG
jgi:hypothetical protein